VSLYIQSSLSGDESCPSVILSVIGSRHVLASSGRLLCRNPFSIYAVTGYIFSMFIGEFNDVKSARSVFKNSASIRMEILRKYSVVLETILLACSFILSFALVCFVWCWRSSTCESRDGDWPVRMLTHHPCCSSSHLLTNQNP
jgi:hypothetical protein